MGLPKPKVALHDTCSTIYNNTLYSYSPDGFQSLRIEQAAEWELLDSGTSVKGAQCVHATPSDATTQEALYIVGGSSTNATYPGLQRYIFSEHKWETVMAASHVTQNRLYHGAVYLNQTASILIYAGTQDGSKQESSQTFTISTKPGHAVISYTSTAPPTISPLLLPWTNGSAILIGGSEAYTRVMQFAVDSRWGNTSITLAEPLTKNSSFVQCTLVSGEDGSESLLSFDMSVSPNTVRRTVLLNAGGQPVSHAVAIAPRTKGEQQLEERRLTVADWPAYNSTLAPTTTRVGYSLAKSADGRIVVSGGDANNDPLCMFSATENAWLNATSVFTAATKTQIPLTTSSSDAPMKPSTTSAVPSASATATASATALSSSSSNTSTSDVMVLVPVVGAILGVAVILFLILLLLRCIRQRKEPAEAAEKRPASGLIHKDDDEKVLVDARVNYDSSFLDLDHSQTFKGHKAGKESDGSFSSMAILMGRVGHGSASKVGAGRRNSSVSSSGSSIFNKNYKNAISNPIPHENGLGAMNGGLPGVFPKDVPGVSFQTDSYVQAVNASRPRPSNSQRRGSARRSSGWNRYWSGGGGTMNILGFGSRRNTCSTDATSDSQYSADAMRPSETTTPPAGLQFSASVPPLAPAAQSRPSAGFGLNRVVTASPAVSHGPSDFPLTESMSAEIGHSRNGSSGTDGSWEDDLVERRTMDGFSSGGEEFGAAISMWNSPPVRPPRAPSSTYSASNYDPRTTLGTAYDFGFNGARAALASFPAPPHGRGPPPPAHGDVPKAAWHPGHQQESSDMSWLNLGAETTRARPDERI